MTKPSIYVIMTILFCSCTTKNEAKNEHTLGKYVYEDDAMVIHINEHCTKLKFGKDENGHSIYAKHPIDTVNFVFNEEYILEFAQDA